MSLVINSLRKCIYSSYMFSIFHENAVNEKKKKQRAQYHQIVIALLLGSLWQPFLYPFKTCDICALQ